MKALTQSHWIETHKREECGVADPHGVAKFTQNTKPISASHPPRWLIVWKIHSSHRQRNSTWQRKLGHGSRYYPYQWGQSAFGLQGITVFRTRLFLTLFLHWIESSCVFRFFSVFSAKDSNFEILKMAGVSQFNQIFCKTCAVAAPQLLSGAKLAFFPANSVGVVGNAVGRVRVSAGEVNRGRPVVLVRTALDDEWGPEKVEPEGEGSTVAVVEEEKSKEITSLKKALVDSFYGTDRGLKATSETRAEIVELITQLEAKNPTPAPTEALTLLNGKWILA